MLNTVKKLSLSLCLLLMPFLSNAQEVIVNSQNAQTDLSKDTLRAIYSMKLRSWPNGKPITVFVLSPDSSEHKDFCLKSLGLFPYQIQKKWDVLIYSGTGQAPVILKDEQEMIQKVSEIEGAIGYVTNEEVTGNVKPVLIR